MIRNLIVMLTLVSLCIPSLLRAEAKINHIVVLPFTVAKGVDEKSGELLNEVFLVELSSKVPKPIKVVGASDVQALLGLEQQKQLIDCDDTACLVEIGNALGASHLMVPSLGKFGGKFIITSKFLNVIDATVLHRKILYVAATEEALLEGVRQITVDLTESQGWGVAADPAVAQPAPPAATADTAQHAAAEPANADAAATTAATTTEPAPASAAVADEGLPVLLLAGAGLAGVGLLAAGGFGLGAILVDGQVAAAESWEDKQGAATLGLGMLGGTALGALALIGGAALAVVGMLGDEAAE